MRLLASPLLVCVQSVSRLPGLHLYTLIPEVFLEVYSFRETASKSHEAARKEKPLVTLNLSLTFMQPPAVKRVKLVIQKGANDNLAITCLSAANVSTRVVRSSIF